MTSFVTKFFRFLIVCYPKKIRFENGTEMQPVFADSVPREHKQAQEEKNDNKNWL